MMIKASLIINKYGLLLFFFALSLNSMEAPEKVKTHAKDLGLETDLPRKVDGKGEFDQRKKQYQEQAKKLSMHQEALIVKQRELRKNMEQEDLEVEERTKNREQFNKSRQLRSYLRGVKENLEQEREQLNKTTMALQKQVELQALPESFVLADFIDQELDVLQEHKNLYDQKKGVPKNEEQAKALWSEAYKNEQIASELINYLKQDSVQARFGSDLVLSSEIMKIESLKNYWKDIKEALEGNKRWARGWDSGWRIYEEKVKEHQEKVTSEINNAVNDEQQRFQTNIAKNFIEPPQEEQDVSWQKKFKAAFHEAMGDAAQFFGADKFAQRRYDAAKKLYEQVQDTVSRVSVEKKRHALEQSAAGQIEVLSKLLKDERAMKEGPVKETSLLGQELQDVARLAIKAYVDTLDDSEAPTIFLKSDYPIEFVGQRLPKELQDIKTDLSLALIDMSLADAHKLVVKEYQKAFEQRRK